MSPFSFQPFRLALRAVATSTSEFMIPAADIVCVTQSHDLLRLPLQTTMDDKDSGQVVSAVNCYFMCQVGFCNGAASCNVTHFHVAAVYACAVTAAAWSCIHICEHSVQHGVDLCEIHLNQKHTKHRCSATLHMFVVQTFEQSVTALGQFI